jgi:hypothetical protein
VIPTGYRAQASLATNVRGEFAQLGYFNVEEAGAQQFFPRGKKAEKGGDAREVIFL